MEADGVHGSPACPRSVDPSLLRLARAQLVLCLRLLIITVQTVVLLVDLPDEIGRRVSTLFLI